MDSKNSVRFEFLGVVERLDKEMTFFAWRSLRWIRFEQNKSVFSFSRMPTSCINILVLNPLFKIDDFIRAYGHPRSQLKL